MPCYKSKFEGKKRVDVAHQPKPLHLGYLAPRTVREEAALSSPSEATAREILFQENVGVRYQNRHAHPVGRSGGQEGPASVGRY